MLDAKRQFIFIIYWYKIEANIPIINFGMMLGQADTVRDFWGQVCQLNVAWTAGHKAKK